MTPETPPPWAVAHDYTHGCGRSRGEGVAGEVGRRTALVDQACSVRDGRDRRACLSEAIRLTTAMVRRPTMAATRTYLQTGMSGAGCAGTGVLASPLPAGSGRSWAKAAVAETTHQVARPMRVVMIRRTWRISLLLRVCIRRDVCRARNGGLVV